MKQRPTIGIPFMGTSLFRRYMCGKYVSCLQEAGADVRILQPTTDTEILTSYIKQCDGFLFPGGADIDPSYYGQEPIPECGKPNTVRDTMEYPLMELALQEEKPILCICRGLQMLNVVLGGTLNQDIKKSQKYKHSDFLHRSTTTHPINITPNTMLHHLLNHDTIMVNSIHHQTIHTLGEGLIITAKSPDGFVEAVELPSHPFCIAVQWHPEHMARKTPEQLKLFQALVQR